MNVSLVVACALNRVIGEGGGMPWHLPADLARFKKITLGKPVVMGRKTWETLQVRPLPGRRNIVMSRDLSFSAPQAEVAHDLDEVAALVGSQECMVIGGAEVYRIFLPLAKTIYWTQVEVEAVGSVSFPQYREDEWCVVEESRYTADADNPFSMNFMTLHHRARSSG